MMQPERRRSVPMSIKLEVALRQLGELMRQLGFEAHEFELDHEPSLGIRPVNSETGEHIPHQHDAKYLVWRPKVDHLRKTTGREGTSDLSITFNGDVSRAAKVKRNIRAESEFRQRLLAKTEGRPAEQPSRWPKRKLQSRGFR